MEERSVGVDHKATRGVGCMVSEEFWTGRTGWTGWTGWFILGDGGREGEMGGKFVTGGMWEDSM